MPIRIATPTRRISEHEFKEIDFEVMRCAFQLHNEMGKLFQEVQYQHEMLALVKHKLAVQREVTISVTHKSFSKQLRIDFLVGEGVIYEFKKTESIAPAHEAQLLQYMLLASVKRGKVVNFGEQSVTGNLISTKLNYSNRIDLQFDFTDWKAKDAAAQVFSAIVIELLQDIGGFLSLQLYYEAVVDLLGGNEEVIRPVKVKSYSLNTLVVDTRTVSETTAFKLTSFKKGQKAYATQLQKFLAKTNLLRILWVNLHQHRVTFHIITKN